MLRAPSATLAADTDLLSVLAPLAPLVALVGAIAYFGGRLWLDHRARKRAQAFAAARGLVYRRVDNRWLAAGGGYPHGRGRSHVAQNVMVGRHRGRDIAVYEHKWTTGDRQSRRDHHVHKTVMRLPKTLPHLEVTLESILGRVARRVAIKDIELESEAFNRTYEVRGDRRLAYDVLHPRFMEWMLRTGAPGFVISGDYISWYLEGRIDLRNVDGQIHYLDALVGQLPRIVQR